MEGLGKFEKFKMSKINQSPAVKKERKSILNATTRIGDLFDDILGTYGLDHSPVRTSQSQVRQRKLDCYSTNCKQNFINVNYSYPLDHFVTSTALRNVHLKVRDHSASRK